MTNTTQTRPSNWSSPSDGDIEAWEALPRDEQLRQLQRLFASRACNTLSPLTVDEVVARARLKVRERAVG